MCDYLAHIGINLSIVWATLCVLLYCLTTEHTVDYNSNERLLCHVVGKFCKPPLFDDPLR
jgi:hypothetical protein